jgi:hypothetical protein
MTITDKKILFKFTIPEKTEIEENGEKKTISKDRNFVIIKQTSRITEEAQLFYAKTYSRLLEDGIMPAKLVEKRFVQDGGVLSDKEIKYREELYNKLFEYTDKIKRLNDEKEKTEIQIKELQNFEDIKKDLISQIASIEKSNQGLFENTAENLANQKTVIFYALTLSYEKIGDTFVPFFGEGDFDKRKEKLYLIEDDGSEYETKILATFLGIISLFLTNRSITQQDIDDIIKKIE